MAVVIETTVGDFTVDLFTAERPQTCRNFLKLCKIKYYNWSLFHSVQSSFIAQTGDPTGTGKGGESVYGIVLGEKARYYEAEQMPKIKHDRMGLISMVNCGNNMLGSQFFITLGSELQSLDGEHCVFGEITEGLEVVLKFNEAICDGDFRPYQDIRISHTVILEDPYDDPLGLVIPDKSPERTKEALMSDRIGADEVIDDTAGMTAEEIVEMRKEREAKARATILEIVGDLPDADMAPPENVLFVCKLNPVTGDDDLEIIFSRFGKVVGCEVIRDRQTGDSLQYAFVEFADRKSCEDAYFKMDNVLIDDRRIHVDFSQSVSKMRWRGKGKGIQYYDDKEKVNQNHGNSHETNNKNGREQKIQDYDKDKERKCSLREESERKRYHQENRKHTPLDETHRKNNKNNDRRSHDREITRNYYPRNYSWERPKNIYNQSKTDTGGRRKDESGRYRSEKNKKRDDNYRSRDRRDDNRSNNNDERGTGRDRRHREDFECDRRVSNVMTRHEERKDRVNNKWEEDQRKKGQNEQRHRSDGDGQIRYRNDKESNKNGRKGNIDVRGREVHYSSKDRRIESAHKEVEKTARSKETESVPENRNSKSQKMSSSSSSEDSSSESESKSSSESDKKTKSSKKKLRKRKHTTTSSDSSDSDEPKNKIKKKKRRKDTSDSDDSDNKKVSKKKSDAQIKRKQKLKKKQLDYENAKKLKSKGKKAGEGKKKLKNKKSRRTKVSSSSESESSGSSSDSSQSDSRKKKTKSSTKVKKIKKSKKSRKQTESSSSSD
ncbi:peptidyl-prolyl cis-trans isomerase sig-7 [Neodiprion lecontei]|uniref:peptidylprolyl isomerase n=1 Tax=Neodiprion lecontei TaxID=441921 RepID=A0A6J0BR14_NEOLC|nr:peptidyl-prolyl cis-trans isomerase sig-7 [Neodiprion lecontei]